MALRLDVLVSQPALCHRQAVVPLVRAVGQPALVPCAESQLALTRENLPADLVQTDVSRWFKARAVGQPALFHSANGSGSELLVSRPGPMDGMPTVLVSILRWSSNT